MRQTCGIRAIQTWHRCDRYETQTRDLCDSLFGILYDPSAKVLTSLIRLWFLLDFATREHNLMEKFEQNRRKILVRLCWIIHTWRIISNIIICQVYVKLTLMCHKTDFVLLNHRTNSSTISQPDQKGLVGLFSATFISYCFQPRGCFELNVIVYWGFIFTAREEAGRYLSRPRKETENWSQLFENIQSIT